MFLNTFQQDWLNTRQEFNYIKGRSWLCKHEGSRKEKVKYFLIVTSFSKGLQTQIKYLRAEEFSLLVNSSSPWRNFISIKNFGFYEKLLSSSFKLDEAQPF